MPVTLLKRQCAVCVTLSIPSTQEFLALLLLTPGKKRKSSSKNVSCPPKSRKKQTSTMSTSKAKSNFSRPSCRSSQDVREFLDIKSSQPKAISVTSTGILDSSNSDKDLRSEVMGLKKTVESLSAYFTDFKKNSASQVGLDLPAGNQGLGQAHSRVHSESLPRNRPLSPKFFFLLSCL